MSHRKYRTGIKSLAPGWTIPIPASQSVVTVQAVEQTSPTSLIWTFSAPVSLSGGGGSVGGQLQASGDGVTFVSPTSVTAGTNASTLVAVYPAGFARPKKATKGKTARSVKATAATRRKLLASPVYAGSIYRVLVTPTGLSFTGGGALSVPLTGQVTPPTLAAKKTAAAKTTAAGLKITQHIAVRRIIARRKAA